MPSVARTPRYSPNTSAAMSTVNGPSRFNNSDPLIAETSTSPISRRTGATIPPATSMSASRGASARRNGVSRVCASARHREQHGERSEVEQPGEELRLHVVEELLRHRRADPERDRGRQTDQQTRAGGRAPAVTSARLRAPARRRWAGRPRRRRPRWSRRAPRLRPIHRGGGTPRGDRGRTRRGSE